MTRSLAPLPFHDQVGPEVDVLDAQARTFEQAQAGAVEQQDQEVGDAAEVLQDGSDLVPGHDNRQVLRPPGTHHLVKPRQVLLEHHAVEKEQGRQRLVLGGGGDVPLDGQRGQELRDFPGPHLDGIALAVEENVAPDHSRRRPSGFGGYGGGSGARVGRGRGAWAAAGRPG